MVTTNNEMSTFVTVLKGGLNVLYMRGPVRVEQKFIRRSLDPSPDIKVDYVRVDSRRQANASAGPGRAVSSPASTTCISSATSIRAGLSKPS